MNYLTAMLLVYVDNEANAFWCLNYIMEKLNWRQIYCKDTPKPQNPKTPKPQGEMI